MVCLCWLCICAVVYLDADTIVVRNIEELFKCGKFCANLKHSERLNSGVMVVEPSTTLFNDMMSKVKTLPSYTGGIVVLHTNIGCRCFYLIIWKQIFFIWTWLVWEQLAVPSFTGDQGFLNSYYSGFPNAHVFEPDLSQEILETRPVPEMERLSTLYNADVGLYMLANKVLEYR